MKVKRMGITEKLGRIWLYSVNKIKSSESFSKQPTQLIIAAHNCHICMNSFCAIFFPKQKSTRRKQCFVFHDVDLLPLNAQNLYACSNLPIHLSAFVDTFRFNLPYSTLFGGALAISQEIFEAVNGFSNQFSGWGGEDDDFWLNRHSDPKSIIQKQKSNL